MEANKKEGERYSISPYILQRPMVSGILCELHETAYYTYQMFSHDQKRHACCLSAC